MDTAKLKEELLKEVDRDEGMIKRMRNNGVTDDTPKMIAITARHDAIASVLSAIESATIGVPAASPAPVEQAAREGTRPRDMLERINAVIALDGVEFIPSEEHHGLWGLRRLPPAPERKPTYGEKALDKFSGGVSMIDSVRDWNDKDVVSISDYAVAMSRTDFVEDVIKSVKSYLACAYERKCAATDIETRIRALLPAKGE